MENNLGQQGKIDQFIDIEEKLILQLEKEESTIELEQNPIWITAQVDSNEIYLLKGKIASESSNYNSALFQLEFLDKDQNLIEGPYEGFAFSQFVGYFRYIPINNKIMSEFFISIKTLPDTYYIKGGFRTWVNIKSPIYLESHLEIIKDSSINKIYDSIWFLLNQPSINLQNNDYPKYIDYQKVETYFTRTTKYNVFEMESIATCEENIYLQKLGIESFVHFSENIKKSWAHGDAWNKSDQHIYKLNLNAINNSYLDLICPLSGKIVKSNQSFLLDKSRNIIAYRFLSENIVFYLGIGNVFGCKLFLYFPGEDIIINLYNGSRNVELWADFLKNYCNILKTYMVTKWGDVINYLSDQKSKDLVGITGTMNHFGHAILNELSSYQQLFEKNYLSKFKQILVGPNEFIPFNKLFPEFEVDKISRKNEDTLNIFTYIIENNLFVIRPTNVGYLLSINLAKRIYDASVNSCSPSYLQEIENAKKYFPLLWFEIRTNDRIWLNQAEGIAEIVNRLYSDYPNLGVIFAGWSSTDQDDITNKHWIEQDQKIVKQSQALINTNITTFAVVGHKTYEKIAWAGVADIHISTYGSGNIFAEIANKSIIIHANKGWYPTSSMKNSIMKNSPLASELISILPIEYIQDEDSKIHFHSKNYYCNWEGIYHEIVKILNTFGSINTFRLSIEHPKVELKSIPIWITGKINSEAIYLIKGKIASGTLGDLALVQIQFLDFNQKIIEDNYEGFGFSPNIGYYKYLPITSQTMSEFQIEIQPHPQAYYLRCGFHAWRISKSPIILESQVKFIQYICKEYNNIYNLLNLPTIPIHLINADWPENIDLNIAKTYFSKTSKYKEIQLESIQNLEIYPWFESLGIENFSHFIENVQKCKEYQGKSNQEIYDFDLNAIKTGYLESVCPWSGKILKSNQSFIIDNTNSWLFYRFVGNQVFYLIVGGGGGHKVALYFPSIELVINFVGTGFTIVCDIFKSYVVSRWSDVINYLSDTMLTPKSLVAITGTYYHVGHTIFNEFSSYHELSSKNLLINFQKYIVGGYEFIPFDKLFPEVNEDNIIRKQDCNTLEMFEFALKNNYFLVRPNNGSENLDRGTAQRIYSASVKSCSQSSLQKIEEVSNHFPVLWFEIKSNDRMWLNQADGIAKIANQLYSDYPNLAIIFAGWSRSSVQDNTSDIKWIEKDQQIVKESQALIYSQIPTFTIVGYKTYEKIAWAGSSDIHIVTYGSGTVFASIANKPIIIHVNRGYYPSHLIERAMKTYHPGYADLSVVPIENVTEDKIEEHYTVRNYHCNWEGIYQQIIKLLNTLKLKEP